MKRSKERPKSHGHRYILLSCVILLILIYYYISVHCKTHYAINSMCVDYSQRIYISITEPTENNYEIIFLDPDSKPDTKYFQNVCVYSISSEPLEFLKIPSEADLGIWSNSFYASYKVNFMSSEPCYYLVISESMIKNGLFIDKYRNSLYEPQDLRLKYNDIDSLKAIMGIGHSLEWTLKPFNQPISVSPVNYSINGNTIKIAGNYKYLIIGSEELYSSRLSMSNKLYDFNEHMLPYYIIRMP